VCDRPLCLSAANAGIPVRTCVKHFRPEVSVPAPHLPVLVAGNEGDLFDREARFEQAACAFMAQIVEMHVFDLQGSALPTEGSAE
jgi:hypothetical protein